MIVSGWWHGWEAMTTDDNNGSSSVMTTSDDKAKEAASQMHARSWEVLVVAPAAGGSGVPSGSSADASVEGLLCAVGGFEGSRPVPRIPPAGLGIAGGIGSY